MYCLKGHVHLWQVAGIFVRVVPNLKVALQDQGLGLGGPGFRPWRAKVTALQGQGLGLGGPGLRHCRVKVWHCGARV